VAEASAVQALAAQVLRHGFDDVQHGAAGHRGQRLVPEMGRVARDRDQARAGFAQETHARDHGGQGIFAALRAGIAAVGNARVIEQQRGNVLLVGLGRGQGRQPQRECRAGHGSHAAEYAQVTTLRGGCHLYFRRAPQSRRRPPARAVRARVVDL